MNARTAQLSGGGKKVRRSGIELLRIFAMLGIILCHLMLYSGAYLGLGYESTARQVFFASISGFGKVGVAIFFMITGYFLCERKTAPQPKRVWPIIRVTLFYLIVSVVLSFIFLRDKIDFSFPFNSFVSKYLDIFNCDYWFMAAYVLLMIFTPQIKKMLDCLSKGELIKCCVVITLLASVGTDIWRMLHLGDGISDNFHFPTAIVYCLIGYTICRIKDHIRGRSWAICALLLGLFLILISPVVSNYYRDMGFGELPDIFKREQATGTLLVALGSFIIFMKIKWQSRVVNYLASWTLAEYLIHNNPFVLWVTIWHGLNSYHFLNYVYLQSFPKACFVIVVSVLGTYITCGLIEAARRLGVRVIMGLIGKIKCYNKN